MMSELKLEVGKRYETVSGGVVEMIRAEADGTFMGRRVGCGHPRYWHSDGRVRDRYLANTFDLNHCLDDKPELVDLTKIDVPFGELDEQTQDRLAGAVARGAKVQRCSNPLAAWEDMHMHMPPAWLPRSRYRLKPAYTMPTVDDKVWLAMPKAKAVTWDGLCGGLPRIHEEEAWKIEPKAKWVSDGFSMLVQTDLFGDLIQRGKCPWDQAIVLRPEGL